MLSTFIKQITIIPRVNYDLVEFLIKAPISKVIKLKFTKGTAKFFCDTNFSTIKREECQEMKDGAI